MKILIAPDSLKGSISSQHAARAIETDLFDRVITLDSYSRVGSVLMAHPAYYLEKAAVDNAKLPGSF